MDWGIELPFDKDFVNYVWFDALTNYISFAGYDPKIDNYEEQPPEFRDLWTKNTLQIIGKDILVPAHGIYWLIMLHAIGFLDDAMPQLLVHGWWNISGAKMSKSEGNVVDPFALADKYGPEALRYYLMSDIATGKDADFSEERVAGRYKSDLSDNVGNLLNRTLNMANQFGLEKLSARGSDRSELSSLAETEAPNVYAKYKASFELFRIDEALGMARALSGHCNIVIDALAPWKLRKQQDQTDLLKAILYHLAESLRIVAVLISPVLPQAAHGIFDQLNWEMDLRGKEERFRLEDAEWGGLPDEHVVGKPVPLFPRIETD